MNRSLYPIIAGLGLLLLLTACDDDESGSGGGAAPLPGTEDQPPIRLQPGDESLGTGLGRAPDFVPPVAVEGRITQAVAGDRHVCAVDEAGRAWCWGDPVRTPDPQGEWPAEPTPVGSARYARLVGGPAATCGITAEGALDCWGPPFGIRGGGPTLPWRSAETDVRTAWLTGVGTALAIDRGAGAVLVIAETQARATVQFAGPPDEVVANNDITCARIGGDVWCVGPNTLGTGGTGDRTQLNQPTRVAAVDDADGLSLVGGTSVCALERGGAVKCWPGFTTIGPETVSTVDDARALTGGCVLDGDRLRCGAPGLLSPGCALEGADGGLSAGARRACAHTAEGWICAGRPPAATPFAMAGLREMRLEECAP